MSRQDLAFHIDETWVIECTVSDPAKQPITLRAAEWRLANPTTRLVKVTDGDGSIVIGGPGQCIVTVDISKQTGIPPGTYDHELWIVDDVTGNGSVVITGQLTLVNSLKNRFP